MYLIYICVCVLNVRDAICVMHITNKQYLLTLPCRTFFDYIPPTIAIFHRLFYFVYITPSKYIESK